jgi:hypothetical protein
MSCKTGKKPFRNRAAALRALVRCTLRRSETRRERGVYRCRHCQRWHMTSQEKSEIDIEFLLPAELAEFSGSASR